MFRVLYQNYGFFILLILLFSMQLHTNRFIEKGIRLRFWGLIGLAITYVIISNLETYYGDLELGSPMRSLLSHIAYLLKPLLLYGVLLISLRKESLRIQKLFAIPWLLMALLLLISLPTGIVCSYSIEGNHFHEGPLFPLTWMVLIFYLAAIVWSSVFLKKPFYETISLSLAALTIGLNILLERVFYTIRGQQESAIAFALLTYYLNFQSSSYIQERVESEKALQEARIRTLVAQIHPHFVCNSLSCIAEICHDDAPEAEESVMMLAKYLRSHYQALENDNLIPFSTEIENIRYFLSLEQQIMGNRLHFVIDTPETSFRVPNLSIETLVENAIRHGLSHKRGGGTLTLTSSSTDDSYLVTVADNGLGFDPATLDHNNKNHIGLINSRAQLAMQCQAQMTIDSAPGQGCTIRVKIPKEEFRKHE